VIKSSQKHRLEYFALKIVLFIFSRLPLAMSRMIADILSGIVARVIRLRREVAMDNLNHAFPEKSETELERIYIGCWRHFIRVGAEISKLPMFNRKLMDRWMDTEALSVFEDALLENKGVIFASGHFGNWEWLGGALHVNDIAMTYVVTAQSNPLSDRWLFEMRKSIGADIVYKKDAVRGVIKALRNNRVIAMLNDQDAHESGVFVPFFGRMASTPRGVAVFHLKTGCPVVFGKTIARKDGKYQIHLERMRFDNLTGNREQDEYIIMAKITARLEEEIRLNPEQWLWLHRRWKTKPP